MRPLQRSFAKVLGIVGASAILLTLGAVGPAAAKDYTRSCSATVSFGPSGGNSVSHRFTGKGTVGTYMPNTARERARRNIDECLDAAMANPHGLRPRACTEANKVYGYPFGRLHTALSLEACNANPGRASLRLGITVLYDGDRGCLLDNNSWSRTLARNYEVTCAARNHEPGTDRPGMDYRHFQTHGGWQACQSRCESESQCRAWTYVAPGVPDGPGTCWLKNGVPAARPCPSCTSGVRVQLH